MLLLQARSFYRWNLSVLSLFDLTFLARKIAASVLAQQQLLLLTGYLIYLDILVFDCCGKMLFYYYLDIKRLVLDRTLHQNTPINYCLVPTSIMPGISARNLAMRLSLAYNCCKLGNLRVRLSALVFSTCRTANFANPGDA